MHSGLREQVRIAEGRNAQPSAAILDSQSIRAAETVARTSRGFDGGKKINGRKRHIAVDTCGLLLVVLVTGAGVQDRHGARLLLWTLACAFARISMVWVDGGYSGGPVDYGFALGLAVEVVSKLAGQIGFTVLPRRWVVERTIGWLGQSRRLSKDDERLWATRETLIYAVMSRIVARRLARP